jgi:hypothetical protein
MAFPICTPGELGELINCLKCVSADDLVAFQLKILLDITGTEITETTAGQALCAACYSDDDLLRMTTALWAEYAVEIGARTSWSVEDLRDETKCWKCTDVHNLKGALVLLLCTFLASRAAQ